MKPLLCLALFWIFATPAVFARWATPDDADIALESFDQDVRVSDDGTYELATETTTEILREGGRAYATYRLVYNSRASRFKLLEAETINSDGRQAVESDFIEDKTQASQAHGFDETRVVSIAF